MKETPKIVTKNWGHEEWLTLNNHYCFKKIFIKAGFRSSLQYHEYKRETNYVLSGRAKVTLGEFEEHLVTTEYGPGEFFSVAPGIIHRVEAIEDYTALEVSTPEVDDVIRLQDDTNRPNGRIESEHGL